MTFTAGALLASVLAASAAIPLPEHPRPDWERADWVNLNGEWDFRFEGREGWQRKIVVPFGWGAPLSGVEDLGDTGWYRREVRIPEAWKGKRVFVVVGAADHDTTCFFDGEQLGSHSGGYVPFEFELTDFVRWGSGQTLEFKVWDPPPKAARDGHYLYGKQGYGNARGIWQTVYLEARGNEFLAGVRFMPSIADGTVAAVARLAFPAKEHLDCVFEVEGRRHVATFEPGELMAETTIKLDSPRLWTLDDPYLYDVVCTVGSDRVKTYFGFREIGIGKNPNGDNYLTLNGKCIYLQLCLDQSYHPEGFYTFPSDEFMKNEILIAKKLALTGNRIHIKAEIPRKLYWADRLGVLIQADVPCAWGDASAAMFEEHWKCFLGMVHRDFNHPCIYQWTLFNETWGLFSNRSLAMGLGSGRGGKKRVYRRWAQERVAEAYLKAKFVDPTRIVEDNSPCNLDHVATDVNTWHAYRPGYAWEKEVSGWCRDTVPGGSRNYVDGAAQTDAPMMNSECGNVWGYSGSTGDCDFSWDYHLMVNAFRRHLKCAGWLYTEHHDVTNEWNGYVRFDRTWKETGFEELAGMSLAGLHRDAAIVFLGTAGAETGEFVRRGAQAEIPVGVSFVTDAYAGKRLELETSAWWFDGEGRRQERAKAMVPGTFEGRSWQTGELWRVAFAVPEQPAAGCVVFSLRADGKEIARNFWSFATAAEEPKLPAAASAEWSIDSSEVLDGLKYDGFGRGYVEYELDAPAEGGVFRAELGAKRFNGKDAAVASVRGGLDYMLGGGEVDRSRNPNSYPQTSVEKHASRVRVVVGGKTVWEQTLPDDPADSRGILSWLSQPRDGTLREAGSYGYLVEAPVSAAAVKDGRVTVRIEADEGVAVYGPAFGRYPFGPHISAAD